jgi:TPR repeat protein
LDYTHTAIEPYTIKSLQIGLCYERGEGVEKDLAEAFRYYKKAAEMGLVEAQVRQYIVYL